MSLTAKLRRAPGRVTTGAFILNAGIGKLSGDDDTAKTVHDMASGAYPVFQRIEPKLLMRAVAAGEIAVGGALLLPIVPAAAAGAALTLFSGTMLGMYWRTPGMHKDGSPLPTPQGVPLAKDVWMLGIGAHLLADGLLSGAHDKRIQAAHALHDKRVEVVHALHDTQVDASHVVKNKGLKAAQAVKDTRRAVRGPRSRGKSTQLSLEDTRRAVEDTRRAVQQRSLDASRAVRKAAAVNAAKSAALAESARKASKKASKRAQKASKQARQKISH